MIQQHAYVSGEIGRRRCNRAVARAIIAVRGLYQFIAGALRPVVVKRHITHSHFCAHLLANRCLRRLHAQRLDNALAHRFIRRPPVKFFQQVAQSLKADI